MSKQLRKKILCILHYPPPVHGAAMVGKHIKESEVINSSFDCDYVNLSTSSNVAEIGKNGWSKWKRFFEIFQEVYKIIKNKKPDLVYLTLTATGLGFFKDALVVLLIKAFSLKFVYHFHNKGVSINQHKWIYNLFYKLVFKQSWVILLAPQLYRDIEKYVPHDKVIYCPNGIPEQSITEVYEKPILETPQILFLSNLIESKGVYVLLGACKILNAKHIAFRCIFVGGEGDITEEEFQHKVAESGLQDSVNYLGKKFGADKEQIYSESDIFALPSYYYKECFPLVLLEAMQHGLPIVSTPEGGIQSIIKEGETGFLVNQNDEKALAEKLECLILNPELSKKMGANGRQHFLNEFTLKNFETKLVKTFDQIIKD